MPTIHVTCSCNEKITYFLDPANFDGIFGQSGTVAILIPHKDHFVTAWIDKNFQVRGRESVLLVKQQNDSIIVQSSENQDINAVYNTLAQEIDPSRQYMKFLASLLQMVQKPEDLFIIGRITGQKLWQAYREPILKMGAKFTIQPDLVLATEIIPLLKKNMQIDRRRGDSQSLTIEGSVSPQFTIGVIQGILDALQESMKNEQMSIEIEYTIAGPTIFMSLLESKV